MTATAVTPEPTRVLIDSIVLGSVEVAEESVFVFPNGLHGFETHTRFALIPAARDSLFWLQSLFDRDVVFLLIDPFVAAPGFAVDLGLAERTALGLEHPSDVLVLAIVTLPGGTADAPTANLRGPIVLNARKQCAQQVMSAVAGHDVRTPIDLNALPARA
jgi:flagellar assembly factor FliW